MPPARKWFPAAKQHRCKKIGVVSSGGFTTLDDLVASLDMKAADAGATHYRITSATGMNKLSGTAVLYR
ncbi:protein [Escherichia coli]|uniref:Protein n=1 Tax=Escherichia coli TaxID=562 RepID=A0A377BC80_ECOLX|nr:protein [Escherichia coli]